MEVTLSRTSGETALTSVVGRWDSESDGLEDTLSLSSGETRVGFGASVGVVSSEDWVFSLAVVSPFPSTKGAPILFFALLPNVSREGDDGADRSPEEAGKRVGLAWPK